MRGIVVAALLCFTAVTNCTSVSWFHPVAERKFFLGSIFPLTSPETGKYEPALWKLQLIKNHLSQLNFDAFGRKEANSFIALVRKGLGEKIEKCASQHHACEKRYECCPYLQCVYKQKKGDYSPMINRFCKDRLKKPPPPPPPPPCITKNKSCTKESKCCSGTHCQGPTEEKTCVSCFSKEKSCTKDSDCCNDLECWPIGENKKKICIKPTVIKFCVPSIDNICKKDSDCCPGYVCADVAGKKECKKPCSPKHKACYDQRDCCPNLKCKNTYNFQKYGLHMKRCEPCLGELEVCNKDSDCCGYMMCEQTADSSWRKCVYPMDSDDKELGYNDEENTDQGQG